MRVPMLVLVPLVLSAGCSSAAFSGISTGGDDFSRGDDGGALDAAMSADMAIGGPTVDPGDISKGRSAGEAETHVAAADNGYVAAAWIALLNNGSSNNGYAFSTDDGVTWQPPQSLGSPGGRVSSDPVLAADGANNFYLTWVGFRRNAMGNGYDMHVYVAKAAAGTTTFGAPMEVTQPSPGDTFDKPWIIALNDGSVLVTYAQTSTGGIYAARSTDFANWDNQAIVEDRSFRNLVFPCQGSTGSRVYATYISRGGVGLRWSDDGGTTWDVASSLAVAAADEQRAIAFDDPNCAAEGDTTGSFRRTRSTDGGKTWVPSIAVRDPQVFVAARDTPKWLGDYTGLYWTRDNLYMTFTDNRGPLVHVGFYRTAAPPLM